VTPHLGRPGAASRAAGWAAAVAAAAAWFAVAAVHAANQPLWLDEAAALASSIRGHGFAQILADGAPQQASPSPLDYLLVKGLDEARRAVRYLGLPPLAYFRLVALLSTLAAGVFILATALAGARRPKTPRATAVAGALGTCAALAFLLDPTIFHFAGEMRPYALWTALWVVSALSFLGDSRTFRFLTLASLVLLSVAATASSFQLTALAAAMLLVESLRGTPIRRSLTRTAAYLALPFALCLFYCLKVGSWNFPESSMRWTLFLGFWGSHWWVAAVSAAAVALCLMERETLPYAVPPLAMLIVYLLGPAVFWVTRTRAVFFTQRHYLYYWTAVPIACVTVAWALAAGGVSGRRRARSAVAAVAVLFCVFGTVVAVWRTIPAVAREWTLWQWRAPAVPADPDGLLAGLLARELPRGFCVANQPSLPAQVNIALVAEWLPVRDPSLPIGDTIVSLETRGDRSEVRTIGAACESATLVTVIRDRPR